MASMEEINGQLTAAKTGFEQGAQLAQSGSAQARILEEQLMSMWGLARQLQNTDLASTVEGLAATVAVARDSNSDAVDALRGTFQGESTWNLNPHIRKALKNGDEAHRGLVEGEQVGLGSPIGLEGIQQRIARIGEHLAALMEEVDVARMETGSLRMHLNNTADRSSSTAQGIAAYQQENGLA